MAFRFAARHVSVIKHVFLAVPDQNQRAVPIVALTAGVTLIPKTSVLAEAPQDSAVDTRVRKPIYETPTNRAEPSARTIAATTPAPASGITDKPQDGAKRTSPSPTDRLAAQVGKTRLLLHRYAVNAEDAVNGGMDSALRTEQSFTSTVASLAPPKESNEKLLPGGIYVLVAAMAGSILSRNRNILIRFVTPVLTGAVTANYVIPRTTENVASLIWKYEEKYPAIRDNHLRVREGVRHFVETGRAHSQMGLAMAEERVQGVRESVEDWVKKGQ